MIASDVVFQRWRQTSNIRRTKSKNWNVSRHDLQLPLPNPLKPGWVENEDVVGAAPTGDAPTTSEWSTLLLPSKVWFILDVWRYVLWRVVKLVGYWPLGMFNILLTSYTYFLSLSRPIVIDRIYTVPLGLFMPPPPGALWFRLVRPSARRFRAFSYHMERRASNLAYRCVLATFRTD